MGMTISEKIIARSAGVNSVKPGSIVTCSVDIAMIHDSSGPRRQGPRLKELGLNVWDPSKVVVISDHYVPAVDSVSANILKITRDWVKEEKIQHFYDLQGICHIVLPERGHLKPGLFCVGGDSHSPTGGAFGAFMIGVGATDMTAVLATGEIWIRVPETMQVDWTGKLNDFVTAKDMMLALCGRIGLLGADYMVCEFTGETVKNLSMDERMVLTNMTAEVGAKTGIIAPDSTTLDFLSSKNFQKIDINLASDENANYSSVEKFDANSLEPQIAAPHSPANSRNLSNFNGIKIDQAYIGACTGAKLEDLHMAAKVLKGKNCSKNTRLLVAPSSVKITAAAAADGTLETLTQAGALLLPSGCGACAGLGAGVLSEKEVCISTTNRNFKGRMGDQDAEVYLGSPYTVAAAAIAGKIVDPREIV
ncbi:MAG: 3-isopropylmalate dehydratase [Rhodospirillaceae bacterium]|mgnify:FL=1|nr:3-isopropylmalate dehydratase [Rhodospirillaceae bacterium]|tara:strand:- start:6 stop:1265 length:1260 start_codon:yes stop_codon:yes gene_type:complete